MSAVDRVRETARLMRERAEAARASLPENVPDWHSVRALMGEGKTEGDAEHIASLDPEVAGRIADLLDVLTDAAWPWEACDDGESCDYGPCVLGRRAQALADAYLGGES